ncbi:Fur family transcriptional regulator [Pseudothermotoga thermarum]|uniref:Ferric uptake regulator, Fur family n=1 Tax=Pseudothermotoga thermarum DSM 5069 TaxID=688269 RepID=F7YU08_9THEM|nr:transcriptional repressor [Pseudothermotoga thermarum]AEH51590.1 ferric uptake regulator, Fur family [Pseudothermotoga thermarum DSM 5069]
MKPKREHLTKTAMTILKLLENTYLPLNAYQISKKAKIPVPSVYRNISVLEEENLVKSFEFRGFSYYYPADRHVHYFVCNNCGAILPVMPCQIKEAEIEKSIGGKILDHTVIFQGICKDCLRKEV